MTEIIEGEIIATSPLPTTEKTDSEVFLTMSFFDALRSVSTGSKITRTEWGDKNIYGEMKDGMLMLHKVDNKFYNWIISDGDMLSDDWFII